MVAPCTRAAADHAVTRWHYSAKTPRGKLACFGVWEHGVFVGSIVYGRGASNHLGRPYGLEQLQVAELVRVALTDHAAPVTQMIAATLRQLRASSPGLRLVVSFADTTQGHHGGIYQAGNWLYTGTTPPDTLSYIVHGREIHGRTLRHLAVARGPGETAEAFVRRTIDPHVRSIKTPTLKHRYLYPLDRAMRRQLRDRARPYPPRLEVPPRA
ncbi:Mom family adenine methylcarbamoylation protein [Actinokineospora baliensis]|uniref:Mom family adenine methylcarbamoylation protein n=1 Tax=Actinokineospora baliensis TaxID=547056 RepID=UPI003FD7AFC6